MSPSDDQLREAKWRLNQYRGFYLKATRAMCEKAAQHECNDTILAYLCLWVAFNNLYSLNSFLIEWGSERDRIKRVLGRVGKEAVSDLLADPDYGSHCNFLRQRTPRGASGSHGILNMQDYFRGKPLSECVSNAHLPLPSRGAPVKDKRAFLEEMVTKLLYTARNNLFHALKGPQDDNDIEVARRAYCLLQPIVRNLLEGFELQWLQVGGTVDG